METWGDSNSVHVSPAALTRACFLLPSCSLSRPNEAVATHASQWVSGSTRVTHKDAVAHGLCWRRHTSKGKRVVNGTLSLDSVQISVKDSLVAKVSTGVLQSFVGFIFEVQDVQVSFKAPVTAGR